MAIRGLVIALLRLEMKYIKGQSGKAAEIASVQSFGKLHYKPAPQQRRWFAGPTSLDTLGKVRAVVSSLMDGLLIPVATGF